MRSWPEQWRSVYRRALFGLLALADRSRAFVARHLPDESQHLFVLTLLVGVLCGFVAVFFHLAIRASEALLINRALSASGHSWMLWTILTPTLGGLLAGLALSYLVPNARGSGIPQVKVAFATEGGRIRFRDALGKLAVSSLQIGSGASLGREGPTVQICAGAASLLARLTSLPPRVRWRLMPVGSAAGIAAAFNAPIAAVTFTIEEIVGTLDQAVLSGVVVAAALAAVIERGILGEHPVISVNQELGLDHASSLALYAGLGVVAAFVSVAFTDGLLKVRAWFRSQRVLPGYAQPAIGGLVTGVLAVVVLHFLGTLGVTGGGYHTLGRALSGELALQALIALCAVKMVATVFSYASGGAGGIFAPSLFIGAMLGGAVGHLDVLLLDHESRQLGAFALVGMGAVFAGVIRAPITSVLIIFEMTGGYGLVLPLMIANMTSYVLARRMRPEPIYDALLRQDGIVLKGAAPSAVGPRENAEAAALPSDFPSREEASCGTNLPMDPNELIAGRTRETTIARDAEGRWFHDGQALEHPNLTRAFDRWVGVAEDGRYCLKNDINWAYITLEGAPFFVRSVRAAEGGAEALLSNDDWQPIDPSSLRLGPEGAMYCDGPAGLAARFDRHAMTQLEAFLGEDQAGIYVELGGTRVRPRVTRDPLASGHKEPARS